MEGESAVDYTEDDDRKVFVSRIPRSYNDEDLQSKFEEVFGPGAVEQANVSFDKELEQGKGFGFVVFKTKVQKIDALKAMGVIINERVPLSSNTNKYNEKYISTKIKKLGHLI